MTLVIRRTVLFGAPLAMFVLGLVHPLVGANPYRDLRNRLPLWLGVHLVLPLLVLGLAAVLYLLVEPVPKPWRIATRLALAPFLVFYGAFDVVVGIGTGVLVQNANALTGWARSVAAFEIAAFFDSRVHWPVVLIIAIAGAAWAVSCALAAVGLRRAGAPLVPLIALILGGVAFGLDHAIPYGPAGMGLMLVAVTWLELRPWPARRQSPADRTGAASYSGDVLKRLRKLGELRDTGVLTEDEFDTNVTELLKRL